MNPFLNIIWILIAARLIIAVQLTRVARKQKLSNLLWLAAFFYVTSISDIFFTLTTIINLMWLSNLLFGLGEVVMVMFIHKTFYQDRKSPFLIFMVIALAFLVADLFADGFFPYVSPFNWLWLIWVSYQAYKRIAADRLVEDWVKARYKLVIAYSLVAMVISFYSTLHVIIVMVVPATAEVDPIGLMVAGMSSVALLTIGIVLEYLAWVMPEGYRRFLNRNYRPPVQEQAEAAELSEEEIMRKLKARS